MRRRLLLVAAGLVVAAGLLLTVSLWMQGQPEGPFNVNGAVEGELVLEPLTFETRYGDTTSAESGTLVVRESRSDKSSNLIRLAFVRFPTEASRPGTPVLFLAGGPGSSAIEVARGPFFHLFMRLRERRDVLVLDQRGVGRSIPDLACPNSFKLSMKVDAGLEQHFLERITRASKSCVETFRRRGVEVGSYNDEEAATDVDELRRALGYPAWSLFGYSHGTQLAQIVMRRYGAGVERAVLAGPVAPDLILKLPSSYAAVVERLGAHLERDPQLAELIPDLPATVRTVHHGLRPRPVEVQVPIMDVVGDDDPVIITSAFRAVASINPELEVMVGSTHLDFMASQGMGGDFWIHRLPAFYHPMAEGNLYGAARLTRNFRRHRMPSAVLIAASCATGVPADRLRRAEREGQSEFIDSTTLTFGRSDAFCAELGLDRLDADHRRPVSTEHPVLFLVGTLDAITPLENLPELRSRFPESRQVIIDAATHQGLVRRDTAPIIIDFLSGERVEDTVVEREFHFEYPVDEEARIRDSLRTLFERQGVTGLKRAAGAAIAPDGTLATPLPMLRADRLNALGYALLAEDRAEAAVTLLAFATELRPARANAWDSFGEALVATGRTAEAITAYEKSLELDFMNANAYERLRRLPQP